MSQFAYISVTNRGKMYIQSPLTAIISSENLSLVVCCVTCDKEIKARNIPMSMKHKAGKKVSSQNSRIVHKTIERRKISHQFINVPSKRFENLICVCHEYFPHQL